MTRDLTIGATLRRIHANGYAGTSALNSDRIVSSRASAHQRDSAVALSEHPAAVMCYPRISNGSFLEDGEFREVISLVVTAYLLSDSAQWKGVKSVLEEYGLLSGPVRTDAFGNLLRPLKWSGPPIFDGEHTARLTFDEDDATVFLEHAIEPGRYIRRTDEFGRTRELAAEPIGTHLIPLDGEWRNGDLLSTPRDRLPELLPADRTRLIADIERARWELRPAVQKSAAA